jgi:hypothetical protein
MDSSSPAIKELLEFGCVRPLRTVGGLLEAGGAGALLDDPLVGLVIAWIRRRCGRLPTVWTGGMERQPGPSNRRPSR